MSNSSWSEVDEVCEGMKTVFEEYVVDDGRADEVFRSNFPYMSRKYEKGYHRWENGSVVFAIGAMAVEEFRGHKGHLDSTRDNLEERAEEVFEKETEATLFKETDLNMLWQSIIEGGDEFDIPAGEYLEGHYALMRKDEKLEKLREYLADLEDSLA